jgi:hypothetical protein
MIVRSSTADARSASITGILTLQDGATAALTISSPPER